MDEVEFDRAKHVTFFQRTLGILPCRFSSLDSNRLTIAFFALSGLDVLGEISSLQKSQQNEIIEWIYSLQILPDPDQKEKRFSHCGFKGSTKMGEKHDKETTVVYDMAHIAMTYTGLASLLILGDDLARVNKTACLEGVRSLQLDDGSFKSTSDGSENDMRFIYCAACVCTMLNNFSVINIDKAVKYIRNSQSYDGGFGQGPGNESHGGSTFCAVASLVMFNRLHSCLNHKDIKRLQHWCILRQKDGFHGRPHKDDDTCYSFWIGATLKLLGSFELAEWTANRDFILSTQHPIVGGFGKWPQTHPDALHSYMGLCGLSLMNYFELSPIFPTLNISEKARRHMIKVHRSWQEDRTPEKNNFNRSHKRTVQVAFIIGLAAAVIPWIISKLRGG